MRDDAVVLRRESRLPERESSRTPLDGSEEPVSGAGSRLSSSLASRYAVWAVFALGLVLFLPSLRAGFHSDDHMLLGNLERLWGEYSAPWYDLYRFVESEESSRIKSDGGLPWWVGSGFHTHFLRPLSSALLTADHALFGRAAMGYHAHSLLWLLAFLAGALALYRRCLTPTVTTIALAVLATSHVLAHPVIWISARHMLVSATFVAAGLTLMLDAREHPRRRWLAPLCFAVALLGGEAGLGGLAYWFAYEMLDRSRTIRSRLSRAAGPVTLGVGYLVVYTLAGGGTRGSDWYIHPIADPLRFGQAAAARVPIVLGDALLGTPSAMMAFVMPARPLVILGLLGAALLATLLFWSWPRMAALDRKNVAWLLAGALLATLGVVGGVPSGREITVAMLGFAAALAVVFRHGFARPGGSALLSWPRRGLVGTLVLLHLGFGSVFVLGATPTRTQQALDAAAVTRQAALAAEGARRLVLLAGSDPMVGFYTSSSLLFTFGVQKQAGDCWSWVSPVRGTHRFVRTGPSSLLVEPSRAGASLEVFEKLFRSAAVPFRLGDRVRACGITYAVTGVANDLPTRIELTFDVPLEDPGLALLVWREGQLRRVDLAELAGGFSVAWSPGPMLAF